MADEATQLRKGVLELATLALLRDGPMYGGQIVAALASRPGLAANPGTMYPLLARLAHTGAVTTTWESSPNGPPRKYYRISPGGRRALIAQTAVWREMSRALDSILEGGNAGKERACREG